MHLVKQANVEIIATMQMERLDNKPQTLLRDEFDSLKTKKHRYANLSQHKTVKAYRVRSTSTKQWTIVGQTKMKKH